VVVDLVDVVEVDLVADVVLRNSPSELRRPPSRMKPEVTWSPFMALIELTQDCLMECSYGLRTPLLKEAALEQRRIAYW